MCEDYNIVEKPCVGISNDNESMTIHNYINFNGKMVLDKSVVALLMIEL